MAERCPGCGYLFEREEGFFLGAYVVNLAVTQVAVVAYIALAIVLTLPDPPLFPLAVGGAVVAGLIPAVAYPFAKTVWTAIDLVMHPAHLDDDQPRSSRPG